MYACMHECVYVCLRLCVCVCVCVFVCKCERERQRERESAVGTSFLTKPSSCTAKTQTSLYI